MYVVIGWTCLIGFAEGESRHSAVAWRSSRSMSLTCRQVLESQDLSAMIGCMPDGKLAVKSKKDGIPTAWYALIDQRWIGRRGRLPAWLPTTSKFLRNPCYGYSLIWVELRDSENNRSWCQPHSQSSHRRPKIYSTVQHSSHQPWRTYAVVSKILK